MTVRVLLRKKKPSGYDPEGAWREDEVIGGKLPVVK
jgi:hypothetical protein